MSKRNKIDKMNVEEMSLDFMSPRDTIQNPQSLQSMNGTLLFKTRLPSEKQIKEEKPSLHKMSSVDISNKDRGEEYGLNHSFFIN